jgi:hypothetical protein
MMGFLGCFFSICIYEDNGNSKQYLLLQSKLGFLLFNSVMAFVLLLALMFQLPAQSFTSLVVLVTLFHFIYLFILI